MASPTASSLEIGIKSDKRLYVRVEMAKAIEYPDTIQDAVPDERLKSRSTLGNATLNIVVFITTSHTVKLHSHTILFSYFKPGTAGGLSSIFVDILSRPQLFISYT